MEIVGAVMLATPLVVTLVAVLKGSRRWSAWLVGTFVWQALCFATTMLLVGRSLPEGESVFSDPPKFLLSMFIACAAGVFIPLLLVLALPRRRGEEPVDDQADDGSSGGDDESSPAPRSRWSWGRLRLRAQG